MDTNHRGYGYYIAMGIIEGDRRDKVVNVYFYSITCMLTTEQARIEDQRGLCVELRRSTVVDERCVASC